MLVSDVQQRDSVIHMYMFLIVFFSIRLSRDMEHSSLCYTIGPCCLSILYIIVWGFQVALVVKNPPANAGDSGDTGSIPRSGRSPGGGHGNSLL